MGKKKITGSFMLVIVCILLSSCSHVRLTSNMSGDASDDWEAGESIESGHNEGSGGESAEIGNEALAQEELTEPQAMFLDNYFVPSPVDYLIFMKPHDVKGIYVSANIAGISSYLDPLIELSNQTEINAFVIDVKSDFGTVTFQGMPRADELGLSRRIIPDISALIKKLNENDIYPIARVVCFKDNEAVNLYPDIYIRDENGEIWRDSSSQKNAWMNPYNRDSWKYVVDICKDIAAVGFKEIQFDYIRFDTSGRLSNADFGDTGGLSRVEIITAFVEYAVKELKPLGLLVSADVYGTIINSDVDANIVGQDYTELAKRLDIICPMIYPSHYANNSMNIKTPDLDPYQTILEALKLSNQRLNKIEPGLHRAVIRPWLQDFTATWLKPHLVYTGTERALQIKAVKDSGNEQWLLWDAAVKYESDGVAPND